MIELLGHVTGLVILELQQLIYPKLLTRFSILVFFTNLSLTEFQIRYLVICHIFSLVDGFAWFWIGSLYNNTQLMLRFLKALFLVLNLSYYTLMTFLMMLSVTLSSMLMIILSTLKVMRHLICGNN